MTCRPTRPPGAPALSRPFAVLARHSVSPAEYKAEYEHYLQHRIESELACQQLALCIPQLQSRGNPGASLPQPLFQNTLGCAGSARAPPLCLLWVRLAWAAPTVPGGRGRASRGQQPSSRVCIHSRRSRCRFAIQARCSRLVITSRSPDCSHPRRSCPNGGRTAPWKTRAARTGRPPRR